VPGAHALKAARQQTVETTQALEKMGMDLIGPLPKSKQGHVYALVMQKTTSPSGPRQFL